MFLNLVQPIAKWRILTFFFYAFLFYSNTWRRGYGLIDDETKWGFKRLKNVFLKFTFFHSLASTLHIKIYFFDCAPPGLFPTLMYFVFDIGTVPSSSSFILPDTLTRQDMKLLPGVGIGQVAMTYLRWGFGISQSFLFYFSCIYLFLFKNTKEKVSCFVEIKYSYFAIFLYFYFIYALKEANLITKYICMYVMMKKKGDNY